MSLRVYASLRRQPAQAAVGFVAQTPCIGLRRGGDVGGGGPRVHDPPPFFCLAIYKNEANGRFQHSTPKDGPRPQATGIPTSPVWPDPLHSEPHQYGRTVSLVQPYLPPGALSHEDTRPNTPRTGRGIDWKHFRLRPVSRLVEAGASGSRPESRLGYFEESRESVPKPATMPRTRLNDPRMPMSHGDSCAFHTSTAVPVSQGTPVAAGQALSSSRVACPI